MDRRGCDRRRSKSVSRLDDLASSLVLSADMRKTVTCYVTGRFLVAGPRNERFLRLVELYKAGGVIADPALTSSKQLSRGENAGTTRAVCFSQRS